MNDSGWSQDDLDAINYGEPAQNAEDATIAASTKRIVQSVLREMEGRDRFVIVAHHFLGKTCTDIAGMLGVSNSRAVQIARRAERRLGFKIRKRVNVEDLI